MPAPLKAGARDTGLTIRPPTLRLLAGLAVTLLAVGVYSGYTISQLRSLRELQTSTIDRNRTDSLLLLRIQNGLNSLALSMRDMLDSEETYPLTAWQPQTRRIHVDLEDALAREEKFSLVDRSPSQRRYMTESFNQFWDALDRIFDLARQGQTEEARTTNSIVFTGAAGRFEHRGFAPAGGEQPKRTGGGFAHPGAVRRRGAQCLRLSRRHAGCDRA